MFNSRTKSLHVLHIDIEKRPSHRDARGPTFLLKNQYTNENICALMFEKLGGEVEQAKIIMREMSAAWSLFSLQLIFSS
jgi:hypothetical protein